MIEFPGRKRPAVLNEIKTPPRFTAAVLAPHPDDFDAIGVTMRLLKGRGVSIFLAVLSSGYRGVMDDFIPLPDGISADDAGRCLVVEKKKIREYEQRRSLAYFGLPEKHIRFLKLREDGDGIQEGHKESRQKVEAFFVGVRPDIVFLPHWNDTNATHRSVCALFHRLADNGKFKGTAFFNRDPKTRDIRMDAYTYFDDKDAEWKGELLRFHQSQHQRNLLTRKYGFDERILNLNRKTAADLDLPHPYAEGYEIKEFR